MMCRIRGSTSGQCRPVWPAYHIRLYRTLCAFDRSPEDQRATPRLELTLAGRFEDYSDFGIRSIRKFDCAGFPSTRSSCGELGQVLSRSKAGRLARFITERGVPDFVGGPRSPSGHSIVLGIQGDNPDLRRRRQRPGQRASMWLRRGFPD